MQILIINSKGGCGKSTLAMALADVLDAQIIEHDPQATLALSAKYTKRHTPVKPSQATSKVLIHDTPPYSTAELKELFENVDLILIPCKVAHPDLLALSSVINDVRDKKAVGKSRIVFNEVRRPYTAVYKKVKDYHSKNYTDFIRIKTEIPNLSSFRQVLEKPIEGKALAVINSLINELGLNKFIRIKHVR